MKENRKKYLENYRKKNREKLTLIAKEWYYLNKEKGKANSKKWRLKNKGKNKIYKRTEHLKTRYGLTPDSYNDLFIKQEGKCAICLRHRNNFSKNLHVDHSHKTGKVRALLCFDCNRGLGSFKDNIELIVKASKYLLHYGE